jgi:hypothetical protein
VAVAGEKSYRFTPQQLLDKVKVFDSIVTSTPVWAVRRSNFRERVAVMPRRPAGGGSSLDRRSFAACAKIEARRQAAVCDHFTAVQRRGSV